MSDFRDATFIPSQPPHKAILDFSNTLTDAQISQLNSQAAGMQSVIKAKVVILPNDFHVDNFKQFAYDLGMQWHVSGQRLLVIVDMKDHKVQMLAGDQLAQAGLTSNVISQQIVPQQFVPHMKQHDLAGAISTSLDVANNVATQQQAQQPVQTVPSTSSPSVSYPPPQQHGMSSSVGLLIGIAVVIAACVGLYGLSVRQRKEDNKKLAKQFEERVSPLYEKADQIGSASEFLANEGQSDLKQRVATFFNRMTAFEKAVTEVKQFEKQGKIWDVRDGYLKLLKMLGLMLPEVEKLRTDLNAVTGGVETFKPDETPLVADTADGGTIKIPERVEQTVNYRRPQWTYDQAYYQPVDSGMSGLAMMLMMMNQMEWVNQAHQRGQGRYYDTSSMPWGGSFQRSDDSGWSSSSSSDWGSGSSDGGGFVEGGGSWDSGGGSFDSGGGDSGGGGGDW